MKFLFFVVMLTLAVGSLAADGVRVIGFDFDDTVVFSSPVFDAARGSDNFWCEVNSHPELAEIKASVSELVWEHLSSGDVVVFITARKDDCFEATQEWVMRTFGIKIYFTGGSKIDYLVGLDVSVFYGDSDSDITDAQEVDVTAIRVLRSPLSGYTKKYHPGTFGEKVLPCTED